MLSVRTRIRSLLLLATLAPAQADDIHLTRWTADCGGGFSRGGSWTLNATIGQHDAGVLVGGTFELDGGFWNADPGLVSCDGDATGDGLVNEDDLATVLSDFGTPNSGPAGDLDADGDVDLADLALLLANFGRQCF